MNTLHPLTKAQADRFANNPSHALLVSGPPGAGKLDAARYIATRVLELSQEKLNVCPYFSVIRPDGMNLGIESIRALQKLLQLKTPGNKPIRRVIVLDQAHAMTSEAQNALLKSLEEPPEDTLLILTAPKTTQLKDTIYSRVQELTVFPLSLDQSKKAFPSFKPEEVERAYAMSGGLAGLMSTLLANEDNEFSQAIEYTKKLLQKTTFERLIEAENLSKDKEQLAQVIRALRVIVSAALVKTSKTDLKATSQWHRRLRAAYKAEEMLTLSPNSKLLLTDLMLQL